MKEQPTAARVIQQAGSRPELALEMLGVAGELRSDPWVALTLGDAAGIADAASPGGPLGLPPLFYVLRSRIAATEDATSAVRDLLARGADPNGPGGEEWTNLSVVCSRGEAELCRVLLEAGAEPNDNDSLYHSVEPADETCTRLLLENGAVVNGTVALHHALDYDRIDRVRMLLDHGGDPNDPLDWPALHHAVVRGRSAEFVRLLLERGADPAARGPGGRTVFALAYRRGADDVLDVLRDAGSPEEVDDADIGLRAVVRGEGTPSIVLDDDARDVLIELAMRDVDGLARVVTAVGAGFGASHGGGPWGTLLHHAAWRGRADYVRLLLRASASPDERVKTEYATPLGWAAVGSRYSPVHPHPDFASPDGDYVAVAQLLVAAGARVEAKFAEMAVEPLSDWLAAL